MKKHEKQLMLTQYGKNNPYFVAELHFDLKE